MSEVSTILHLGSNVGDRYSHLAKARELLAELGTLVQVSSIYETEPWGNKDQPWFLNQAVELLTDLAPDALLHSINEIELLVGRERKEKWGPRALDIDIIFFGDLCVKSETLTVPHPSAHERAFVLIPLLDICPERIHPMLLLSVWKLYDLCNDSTEVYLPDVPL
jgi:2-amino-4-hydroxy-6-hydroxymethyldihydropteridine diphosphokinase